MEFETTNNTPPATRSVFLTFDVLGVIADYIAATPLEAIRLTEVCHCWRQGVASSELLWLRLLRLRWPATRTKNAKMSVYRARVVAAQREFSVLAPTISSGNGSPPIHDRALNPIEECQGFEFRCPIFVEGMLSLVPDQEEGTGTRSQTDQEWQQQRTKPPVFFCHVCKDNVYTACTPAELTELGAQARCVMVQPGAAPWLTQQVPIWPVLVADTDGGLSGKLLLQSVKALMGHDTPVTYSGGPVLPPHVTVAPPMALATAAGMVWPNGGAASITSVGPGLDGLEVSMSARGSSWKIVFYTAHRSEMNTSASSAVEEEYVVAPPRGRGKQASLVIVASQTALPHSSSSRDLRWLGAMVTDNPALKVRGINVSQPQQVVKLLSDTFGPPVAAPVPVPVPLPALGPYWNEQLKMNCPPPMIPHTGSHSPPLPTPVPAPRGGGPVLRPEPSPSNAPSSPQGPQ